MSTVADEAHLSQEATNEWKYNDTYKYTALSSVNIYDFMTDSYHGSGGFKDGTYLIPHVREGFYSERRDISYYKNYVKPILNAALRPVFTEKASRIVRDQKDNILDNHVFNSFIENCNNADLPLQQFTKDAVLNGRLHGLTFVIMDNFEAEEQPPTLSEARIQRKFPYVYMRKASDVEAFTLDKFGNIQSIMFRDRPEKVTYKEDAANPNNRLTTEDRWRLWTPNEVAVMKKDSAGKFQPVKVYQHRLGVLPIIPLYTTSRSNYNTIFVLPPYFDIARCNLTIFNQDSEIRTLERSQAFSLLVIATDQQETDMTLGDKNVLYVPTESPFPPQYISPNPAILEGLVKNNERLIEHLYQLAEQVGVVGVRDAKSGIAKQFDFKALESELKNTSYLATWLEQRIADLFALYTGDPFRYAVDYPFDFQPYSLEEELKRYELVLKTVKSKRFKQQIEVKQARLLLNDEEQKTLNEIVDDIEASYQTEPQLPPPPFPTAETGMNGTA